MYRYRMRLAEHAHRPHRDARRHRGPGPGRQVDHRLHRQPRACPRHGQPRPRRGPPEARRPRREECRTRSSACSATRSSARSSAIPTPPSAAIITSCPSRSTTGTRSRASSIAPAAPARRSSSSRRASPALSAERAVLKGEEDREVRRILRRLSGEVGRWPSRCVTPSTCMAQLDLITAKARYSRDFDMYPPDLNTEGRLWLRRPAIRSSSTFPRTKPNATIRADRRGSSPSRHRLRLSPRPRKWCPSTSASASASTCWSSPGRTPAAKRSR